MKIKNDTRAGAALISALAATKTQEKIPPGWRTAPQWAPLLGVTSDVGARYRLNQGIRAKIVERRKFIGHPQFFLFASLRKDV